MNLGVGAAGLLFGGRRLDEPESEHESPAEPKADELDRSPRKGPPSRGEPQRALAGHRGNVLHRDRSGDRDHLAVDQT